MAESASTPLEQGWQNLKLDVTKLRADLAEIAQALVDAGKMEASEARSRMQEAAQQRLDDIRKKLDMAREQGKSVTDVVMQQVEEKPVVSLLVAFGAGMLMGSFMNRR